MRKIVCAGIACVSLLGCSIHPIPDDVVAPVKTEDILRHARCEIRAAVIDVLKKSVFRDHPTVDVVEEVKFVDDAIKQLTEMREIAAKDGKVTPLELKNIQVKVRGGFRKLSAPHLELAKYMAVAVAYDFNFDIVEKNALDGGIGFKIPFTAPSAVDVNAAAGLHLTRQGLRQFKTQDRWSGIILKNEQSCGLIEPRSKNIIYPISGTIGLGHAIRTFVDVYQQGGAKDSFVDTLIFSSELTGSAGTTIKLNPVQNSFRLISADAKLQFSRLDVHKVVISLVFPHEKAPNAITGVERFEGDMNAPYNRPPRWRALYNLCVADARGREDAYKKLRLEAPEVYCIYYADQFAPSGDEVKTVVARKISATETRRTSSPIQRLERAPLQSIFGTEFGTLRKDQKKNQ